MIDNLILKPLYCRFRYIYTDTVQISDGNLFDIVFAAKKLKLGDLEKRCAEYLETKISDDNVGNFVEQAMRFDSKDCIATCLEYFGANAIDVIRSEQFLTASKDTIGKLCECEKISCTDVKLFSACVDWAKAECQRNNTETSPEGLRTALGDIVNKIEFSRMTLDEMMKDVVPTGILTDDHLGKIIYSLGKCPNIEVISFLHQLSIDTECY